MIRLVLAAFLLLVLAGGTAAAQEPGPNASPIAAFDYTPTDAEIDDVITFRSTATDPDGFLTDWTWDFGDGAIATGENVTHAFLSPGKFVVTLTVTDDDGASIEFGREVTVYGPAVPNWLAWSMPMLVGILLLGLSYLVVLKGQPNIYNRVFFFFYCTSGIKSLSEAFLVLVGNPLSPVHTALLNVNLLAGFVLVPLFLWFVLVFPRPVAGWLKEGERGAVALVLVLPFVGLVLSGRFEYSQIVDIFNVYASIVGVLALGLLVYHAWETDSEEERRRIRFLSATFILLVASTLLLTGLNIAYSYYMQIGDEATAYNFLYLTALVGVVLAPLMEIIGAALLMYAILRYQLLGIERFVVRFTRTTIGALAIPITFVTLGNLMEELLQNTVLAGVELAFLIAGFAATLLMIPLQKLITLAINRFFPGWGAHDEELLARRRMEIYEAQLRYSLLDGALKPKEIDLLDRLASSLELQENELQLVLRRFPKGSQPALSAALLRSSAPAAVV